MYLDIMPYSFELAPSKMFLIGKAKYRFIEDDDSPTGLIAKLLPAEADKEFKGAKEVTICFKSPVLMEQYEIGVLNLFYTKVFEPVVKTDVGKEVEVPASLEIEDTPEQVADKAVRIQRCEAIAADSVRKIYEVYRFEIGGEGEDKV